MSALGSTIGCGISLLPTTFPSSSFSLSHKGGQGGNAARSSLHFAIVASTSYIHIDIIAFTRRVLRAHPCRIPLVALKNRPSPPLTLKARVRVRNIPSSALVTHSCSPNVLTTRNEMRCGTRSKHFL